MLLTTLPCFAALCYAKPLRWCLLSLLSLLGLLRLLSLLGLLVAGQETTQTELVHLTQADILLLMLVAQDPQLARLSKHA